MSDEPQKTPDEQEQVEVAASPVVDEEDNEGPLSPEEFRAELVEIAERVRIAWFRPIRRVVRTGLDSLIEVVDGLAGGLEGNNRKKGN